MLDVEDGAALAERYYRLVERHSPPMAVIPWDKLPASHQAVFVAAGVALLKGEKP